MTFFAEYLVLGRYGFHFTCGHLVFLLLEIYGVPSVERHNPGQMTLFLELGDFGRDSRLTIPPIRFRLGIRSVAVASDIPIAVMIDDFVLGMLE
jgi:hypothetical protein